MLEIARNILLVWLCVFALLLVVFLVLRHRLMKRSQHFDPNVPDHVMGLAVMLDGILNSGRTDIRFALVVWQDQRDDVQGLVSNDTNDAIVISMLDDAKLRITSSETIQATHGHGHA